MANRTNKTVGSPEYDEDTLLADVAAFGGYGTFVSLEQVQAANLKGYVEVDKYTRDAQGNVAVRITATGLEYLNEDDKVAKRAAKKPAQKSTVAKEENTMSEFAIMNDVELPKRSHRGRTSKYPWGSLEVGQGFLVPSTAEKPNPAKTLASTASSAAKRIGGGVKFAVRPTAEGALVKRTA